MDFDDEPDEPEPAPLMPGRSDRLCVHSGHQPWQDRGRGLCFGPSERTLSRHVPAAEKDLSPQPPSERSLSRATACTTVDEDLEKSIWEPAHCQAAVAQAPEKIPSVASGSRRLHKAVWLADVLQVKELLQSDANVNEVDDRGATPLMLAVELLPRAREYEDVLMQLLEFEADPRTRSALGWSPLDEAVSRGDERLVKTLFECTQHNLKVRWEDRLAAVVKSLQVLPDFECRVRWEFESPVLPLFNKIAPSDVVHLRKLGTSIRLDSTLASWKRFRLSKRREFTTLFRGEAEVPGGGGSSSSHVGAKRSGPSLYQLNHSKRTITDMTEGLDTEEERAVVDDLVAADVVQWDMEVENLEVAEATTWLGHLAPPSEVNGWKALRFDVRGSLGVAVRKKGSRQNCSTFEDYFGCPLPADACLPEFRQEFSGAAPQPNLSRENSRTSNWSEDTDVFDFQSQKRVDCMFDDIDEVSTCSEVMERWPDPASASLTSDNALKTNAADLRVQYDSRPCRPGGDAGPMPSALRRRLQGEPSETSSQVSTNSGSSSGMSSRMASFLRRSSKKEVGDKVGKTNHRVSASVWLASDFAIPIQQFLPVLEALSAEHEAMRRLKDLLSSKGLKDAAERAKIAAESAAEASNDPASTGHVFPVKVSVPLNLAVRALVHFEAFELKKPGTLSPDLFHVPQGYTIAPRKEAQKTLNRSRKRMLLAQLAL